MGSSSSGLRLAVPAVDTPDYVVEQLADAARSSRVSSARRGRFVVAIATAAGVVLLSIGGAWATGAVNLPGLPEINLRTPQQPTPTVPERPSSSPPPVVISPPAAPLDKGPSSSPGVDPRGSGERPPRRSKGEASGEVDRPGKQGRTDQGDSATGKDNSVQQKDRGRSQSSGRSEQAPQGLQGPEKRKAEPSQAAAGPDATSAASRGKRLGSLYWESRGRG